MKKKKTNIYIEYFRSSNTILTQGQKRLFIIFMTFAGLFVLQTIGGMSVIYTYALAGMLSICMIASIMLTEGGSPEDNVDDWAEPLLLENKLKLSSNSDFDGDSH